MAPIVVFIIAICAALELFDKWFNKSANHYSPGMESLYLTSNSSPAFRRAMLVWWTAVVVVGAVVFLCAINQGFSDCWTDANARVQHSNWKYGIRPVDVYLAAAAASWVCIAVVFRRK